MSLYNVSVTLLRSYLQRRQQCVLVNGTHSQETSVTSGMPQESILGAFVCFVSSLVTFLCISAL